MAASKSEREQMDEIASKLGFQRMEDWYRVTRHAVMKNGGKPVLEKHGKSHVELLRAVYPSHEWHDHLFEQLPWGYWNSRENQRNFLDHLGKTLGFRSMEGWYSLSVEDLTRGGGSGLFHKYLSVSGMLRSVYKEHDWKIWRFQCKPRLAEMEEGDVAEFVGWLGDRLMVRGLEDWYRVSWAQIREHTSVSFFKRFPLEQCLQLAHPEHAWDVAKLRLKDGTSKTSQRYLVRLLEGILPNTRK